MKQQRRIKKSSGSRPGPDALAEVLDTDKLVAQIRYHLGLKQVKDKNNNPKLVLKDNALLNKRGVQSQVGFVRSMVDKNQALSIYNGEQIVAMMRDLHKTVAFDLTINWNNYHVQTEATFDKVVEIVTNNCWSILNRARGGRTLDAVTESAEQHVETRSQSEDSNFPLIG